MTYIAAKRPSLLSLARKLLPRLPRALLCSNTLKTENPRSRYEMMDQAVRRKWMGMQGRQQARINVLVVDCDREGWRERLGTLVSRGLPPPTFTVVSPMKMRIDVDNGLLVSDRDHETAHLHWVLRLPVARGNPKSFDLFKRVRGALVRDLDGDQAATGHLGKNPFHADYVTEVGPLDPVELKDLFEPMMSWCEEGEHWLGRRTIAGDGGPAYDPCRFISKDVPLSKDQSAHWGKLFEARHGIYLERARDYDTIRSMVEEHARAVGSKAKKCDILATTKSIHRFMIGHRIGNGSRPNIDHGVMSRDRSVEGANVWKTLSKVEKRRASAARTAALKGAKTEAAIRREMLRAISVGEVVTQVSLAAAVGLGVRRIQQIWRNPVVWPEPDLRSVQGLALGPQPLRSSSEARCPLTLKGVAGISRLRANQVRVEVAAIAAYRKQAIAMRCPAAEPQAVSQLPPRSPPEVRAAHGEAMSALRCCLRRKESRRLRAVGLQRRIAKRALFAEWARAGDQQAYRAFLVAEGGRWDRMECSTRDAEDDFRCLARVRRAGAFRAHRRDWDAALLGAAMKPSSCIETEHPGKRRDTDSIRSGCDEGAVGPVVCR